MLHRLRNVLFGGPHAPTPATLLVESTDLVLTCEDTSECQSSRERGTRVLYPSTTWTGSVGCKLIDGELDFQILPETPFPQPDELALVQAIVAHPNSIREQVLDAIFRFFDGLRTEHDVDFSATAPNWTRDHVASTLTGPCCFISADDRSNAPPSRFLLTFETDLDPEHGVDVEVGTDEWTVTDCGWLI